MIELVFTPNDEIIFDGGMLFISNAGAGDGVISFEGWFDDDEEGYIDLELDLSLMQFYNLLSREVLTARATFFKGGAIFLQDEVRLRLKE